MLLSLMPELIWGRVRTLAFFLPPIFSIEDRMLNLGVHARTRACVCVHTPAYAPHMWRAEVDSLLCFSVAFHITFEIVFW